MKARIFYRDGKVVALEFDPAHYEDGAYPDGTYPRDFLINKNDPASGYTDLPEHFVAEWDQTWNEKPVAYIEIANYNPPTLTFNQERFDADKLAKQIADKRIEDSKNAIEWKKNQLSSIDWTQVSLSTLERKIIIGVTSFTDEELDLLIAERDAVK